MTYRREIDGLRALAVIPVILFHTGIPTFSGGFVGVDVFFVISGYLIASVILAEKRSGMFSLMHFYERRARRILPALFLVLACCIPFAWWCLPPTDIQAFSLSLASAAAFISNIIFWQGSGYFGPPVQLIPLLHTWALSVEVQYYLLFPLLCLLIWPCGQRALSLVIALIGFASLVMVPLVYYQDTVFFLLHTRLWELLAGALVAFYLLKKNHGKIASETGAITGMLCIICAVMVFDGQAAFPRLYALLPVIGAALVIVFASADTFVGKLLGSRLLVGIGLISYSLYLWHQPIFVFARYLRFEEPGILLFCALIGLSVVLAYLSWRFVEQPFRHRHRFTRRQVSLFAFLGCSFFVTAGMWGASSDGWQFRFPIPASVVQSLQWNSLSTNCNRRFENEGWGKDFCVVGASQKLDTPDIAMFGDSHAASILSAFDAMGKKLGKSVAHIELSSCPPLLGVGTLDEYNLDACEDLTRRQLAYVKSHHISKVMLVARWTMYTDGDYGDGYVAYLGRHRGDKKTQAASRRAFEEALAATVRAYRDINVQVYVLAQIPQQRVSAYKLYYQLYSLPFDGTKDEMIRSMSVMRADHDALQHYTRDIFRDYASRGLIKLIVLDDLFCDAEMCVIGSSEASKYSNTNHLSDAGAMALVDALAAYFR